MEEFENILTMFDEADELSLQNKTDEAEKLYQLVVLKFYILKKKLNTMNTPSVAMVSDPQPSSPVIGDGSSENDSTGTEVRTENVEEEVNPISSSLMVGKEFIYTLRNVSHYG